MLNNIVRNQTSFYEQAILYYIQLFFGDAENRVLFDDDIEADIFVPSINCVIEYDGAYWHEKKVERDNFKNHYFNSIGITVVRISDYGLPDLDSFDGLTLIHKTKGQGGGYHIDEIIEIIIHFFAKLVEDEQLKERLLCFNLPHDIYLQDTPDINAVLYPFPVTDNLALCHGMEYWDYKKNKRLKPENVPWNYKQNVFFKCRLGKSKFVHHSCFLTKQDEPIQEYTNYCPFLHYCKDDCEIQHQFLNDIFSGENNVNQADIPFTKECISKRMMKQCSSTFIQNFDLFFIRSHLYGTINSYTFECAAKWASTIEDLELLKKLHIKYEPIYINIEARNFDTSPPLIDAFIEHFQWLINLETGKKYRPQAAIMLNHSLLNTMTEKSISKELHTKCISLIEKNNEAFKYEDYLVERLKNFRYD